MNILILDYDVRLCAQYHFDKHCMKMIVVGTQLLNNALIKHNKDYQPIYSEICQTHPVSLWVSQSIDNFNWLMSLTVELCKEYSYRYNKIHKSELILQNIKKSNYQEVIPGIGLTPFIKSVPEQYQVEDVVESYRNYYKYDKSHIVSWTKRNIPPWWYE